MNINLIVSRFLCMFVCHEKYIKNLSCEYFVFSLPEKMKEENKKNNKCTRKPRATSTACNSLSWWNDG